MPWDNVSPNSLVNNGAVLYTNPAVIPPTSVDVYSTDTAGWITERTSNNPNIDAWQTLTQTITVNAAASTRLDWYWRVSFDRIVEIRCTMTFTAVPTLGIVNVNAPPAIPLHVN